MMQVVQTWCSVMNSSEVRGRFKREWTHVYLWMIRVNVWQKPTQHCKAIILQLKNKSIYKKKKTKTNKLLDTESQCPDQEGNTIRMG